ncbi:MAG: hypothetical protein FJ271_31500 [Planctomycetes bacterium]|nr:hypothetical protein [Planctomycetota bacterium]
MNIPTPQKSRRRSMPMVDDYGRLRTVIEPKMHLPLPRRGLLVATALASLLAATGCTETRYAPISAEEPGADPLRRLERVVEYERNEELLTQPFACALLLPVAGEPVAAPLAVIIEESITRHLALRIPRVIVGDFRDQQARYHGVTIASMRDALPLAKTMKCEALVEARIIAAEGTFVVFYAGYQLGLDLRVLRVRDNKELWRSRHAGSRSSGGLPLSLAAPVFVWSAASLARDEEAIHSLVDELVRRLFVTWPSARRLG